MKKSTLSKCLLLLAFSLLCASCSVCSASQAERRANYKAIPIEAWEQLKQNNKSLVIKLYELSEQVETLENPSIKLQQELNEAKKQLQQSQAALTELNVQLESVKSLQSKTQTSLEALTKQIEAERQKQEAVKKRIRLQRNLAYFFIGILITKK